MLHVFVFDERYTFLRGFGSAINLSPYYEGATRISQMTFVSGENEELVFIDNSPSARIFSLTSQQFRYSHLLR